MVDSFVIQVVGYQNSGKTTYLKRLLKELEKEKIRAGIIKHHGHGGKPDIIENKDSSEFINAGATVSLVEGEGRILLQAEKSMWALAEQISVLSTFGLDLILVEGHKYEDYKKIVIVKDETDLHLIDKLKNVVMVLFREDKLMEISDLNIPLFLLNDHENIQWLIKFIKSQIK